MKGSKDTEITHINFSYFRSLNYSHFENKQKNIRDTNQKRKQGKTWILRDWKQKQTQNQTKQKKIRQKKCNMN